MTTQLIAETLRPVEALHVLITRHGPLRILLALPAALLQRSHVKTLCHQNLSGHLRRDIGLSDEPGRKQHWEIR